MTILVLPASTAFSNNSLTTDDGRSITSPAAIWLVNKALNSLIFPIDSPFQSCLPLVDKLQRLKWR